MLKRILLLLPILLAGIVFSINAMSETLTVRYDKKRDLIVGRYFICSSDHSFGKDIKMTIPLKKARSLENFDKDEHYNKTVENLDTSEKRRYESINIKRDPVFLLKREIRNFVLMLKRMDRDRWEKLFFRIPF